MSKEKVLEVIAETEILGKKIKLYGSVENPFFKADDVAKWIEHSNVSKMLLNIDEDEKLKARLSTLTNSYSALFLTENGLYEVCMQSRKPIAKEMKREIKKYLKSIRLTGAAIEDEQKTVDYYFSSFSDELKTQIFDEMYKKNQELQQFYDDLMNTEGLMSMNTVAKELKIGEYTLFDYLRKKKVLFYHDSINVPYERFRKEDKFEVKETPCHDGKIRSVIYVTKKGLEYIRNLLVKDGYSQYRIVTQA